VPQIVPFRQNKVTLKTLLKFLSKFTNKYYQYRLIGPALPAAASAALAGSSSGQRPTLMKPLPAGFPTVLPASPPADFPLLPSCSIDEAELLSITPLVALPSPAPDLWVSAGYDDESEDDEVLAPVTPPAASKTADVDAPCVVFAASSVFDSGGAVLPVATTPMPRP
jgi:hypothetical protein